MKRPVRRWERTRTQMMVALGLMVIAGGAYSYWDAATLPERIAEGRELFVHEWTTDDPLAAGGDGLGPVFNASSCVACHFQGGVGGAGPNEHNVTTFTALPTQFDPEVHAGVIHASATTPELQESTDHVRALYPIVPGKQVTRGGCSYQEPDFDPLRYQEINTPALFGMGAIDAISPGAIKRNVNWRRMSSIGDEVLGGEFTNTPAGRVRILEDGRVGKFGWKAQFATLEEFVAAACAVEVGLTNPYQSQDAPRQHAPDEDAELDMTRRQFHSLVEFCRDLDAPRRRIPDSPRQRKQAQRGERLFSSIGCADCHTPNLGGVRGIYSDLALHRVENPDSGSYEDSLQEPLPHRMPLPDEWKTPPLWGVADSAPYWHDGSSPTLLSAIGRHHGEARHVAERFRKELSSAEQQAIVTFLETLRAPVTSGDAPDMALAER